MSAARIASCPTKVAAAKPMSVVTRKKLPARNINQITERRAVVPSGTVKKRVMMCGRPATPSMNDRMSDNGSSGCFR